MLVLTRSSGNIKFDMLCRLVVIKLFVQMTEAAQFGLSLQQVRLQNY